MADFFDEGEAPDSDPAETDALWDGPDDLHTRAVLKGHRLCWDSTHPGYGKLKSACTDPECVARSVLQS